MTPAPHSEARSLPYPQELSLLRPYELGSAILMLMLESGHGPGPVGWAHGAGEQIQWQQDTYDRRKHSNGVEVAFRLGLLRVHVGGEYSTTLKKVKRELGWTVEYRTTMPAKFGPDEIVLGPGVPGEGCFGTTMTGCSFGVEPSLRLVGIDYKKVCDNAAYGHHYTAYELRHPKREPVLMLHTYDYGSGGGSGEVILQLSPDAIEKGSTACIPSWLKDA